MIFALGFAAFFALQVDTQTVATQTPRPEELQLSGRVVTPQGKPIEGAALSLRTLLPFASKELGSAISGAGGSFELRVTPFDDDEHYGRNAYLTLAAPGFAASRLERVYVPSPSYDLGEVVLYAPVELSGSVVDALGHPIAGAEIHAALGRALEAYEDHARLPPIAVSDARGEFSCRALPPGVATLGASAPGFADCVLAPLELEASANRVRFELGAGRSTELVVVDASGAPIPGARARPIGSIWGRLVKERAEPLAFWRGAVEAGELGRIEFEGLARELDATVVVTAPARVPQWIALSAPERRVVLASTTVLDLTLVRDSDGSPVTIYELGVRDGTRERSWCGNCEDNNWLRAWADSASVEVLAPNRWRLEWNGEHSYVRGGQPSAIAFIADDGTSAFAELLPEDVAPGGEYARTLRIEAPSSLSGRVVDSEGRAVALQLGVQLSLHRGGFSATWSGIDGTFAFERLDDGPNWIYSLDDAWEVDDDADRWELSAERPLADAVVRVHPRPLGGAGIARVRLSIAGKPPGEPLLVALDDIGQDLPDAYPRCFAWTDAQGRFEITAPWPREYHLVPKHRVRRDVGGWRDFGGEFPAHDEGWPCTIDVPASGISEQEVDLLAESEWDRVAPPKSDD